MYVYSNQGVFTFLGMDWEGIYWLLAKNMAGFFFFLSSDLIRRREMEPVSFNSNVKYYRHFLS